MTRDFYSFMVAATHPTSGVAETAVLISLPPKTCEGMQITDAIINTTTFPTSVQTTVQTSVDVETTEYATTFSTLIASETIEETTVHTTLVDSETTEKNWNDTIVETTKGYCY